MYLFIVKMILILVSERNNYFIYDYFSKVQALLNRAKTKLKTNFGYSINIFAFHNI